MPDQQTLLSDSGARRCLACASSAMLEAGLPESSMSAAKQGTAAHALEELKLRRTLQEAPSVNLDSSWYVAEMETMTDGYVAFVQERLRDVW